MSDKELRPAYTGALAKINRVAGAEAAGKILATYGGARIYIPKCATARGKLSGLVGIDAARQIVACFEPGWYGVQTSNAAKISLKQRILTATGTALEIARQLGVGERYVRKVRAEVRW